MKYSPEYFAEIRKRYPQVADHFDDLARDIAKAGPLDNRSQLLVKLGVAIGVGSEGDVQNLTNRALDEGIMPDEIRHAVLLSITTAGFPMMIVAMQMVEDILEGRTKKRVLSTFGSKG